MRILNYKTFLITFCIILLHINCAPHCDDEDYTRDQKKPAAVKRDSLDFSAAP